MRESKVRPPAVSGLFYPRGGLARSITDIFQAGPGLPPGMSNSTIAVVVPHAGYQYSGMVASYSYYEISGNEYPYAVMVGPDHRGLGTGISLSGHAQWETPLGVSPVHESSALEGCGAMCDVRAHASEHSLEVQLPMIQYVFGRVPILPILLSDQSMVTAEMLGRHLALKVGPDNPAMIASSDLTHYAPDSVVRDKDRHAIDAMLDLDIGRFYDTLRGMGITACGYGAISTIMQYSIEMGASKGRLLSYVTSGDTGGDRESVVGYCAVAYE